MKILVAEDTDDNRALVREILNQMGHEVHTVADGVEAMCLYEPGKFDLLLLDAMMPNATGYEVAGYVRQHNGQERIVIMTGLSDSLTRPHAHHVRADAVLMKPFNGDDLARVICEKPNKNEVSPQGG